MTATSADKQYWEEFIELYRQHPCLWKMKSKDYSDKGKRNKAYNVLAEKLRERDATATRVTVAKKINNLRSCFRKEIKKVEASVRSGASADDLYAPALWYYDLLLFLKDQETPGSSTSSINDEDDLTPAGKEGTSHDPSTTTTLPRSQERVPEKLNERAAADYGSDKVPMPKRHKSSAETCHTHPCQPACQQQRCCLHGESPLVQSSTEVRDEFNIFADYVASELRTVTDRKALALAKHNINTILFEATTGLYSKHNSNGD
ncbi:uncharacterized protein [Macrobrachium rosenbergii]|uniref:uncharacterized protein n=1 Tax=Macrobrachium rosenbergii TaxID=79674 RepID=UPI0034D4257C